MAFICRPNATLEEKKKAIDNRTPDQKMNRDGVPVSIGGRLFEIRPMNRKRERQFREQLLRNQVEISRERKINDVDELLEMELNLLDLGYEGQTKLLMIAIPELAEMPEDERERLLEEEATREELAHAIAVVNHFLTYTGVETEPKPMAPRRKNRRKDGQRETT